MLVFQIKRANNFCLRRFPRFPIRCKIENEVYFVLIFCLGLACLGLLQKKAVTVSGD